MKKVFCEQGSIEWWALHGSRPTASCFDRIMTPKTFALSKQWEDYADELIANIIRGGPEEVKPFMSREMERGIQLEPQARRSYALETDNDVERVGFCISEDGRFGCSPDGLIGEDGGLEMKIPLGKTQIGWISGGVLPAEYSLQVHGALIVTGRKWWDFYSWSPGLPTFLVRTTPNLVTSTLKTKLDEFYPKFLDRLEKVKAAA